MTDVAYGGELAALRSVYQVDHAATAAAILTWSYDDTRCLSDSGIKRQLIGEGRLHTHTAQWSRKSVAFVILHHPHTYTTGTPYRDDTSIMQRTQASQSNSPAWVCLLRSPGRVASRVESNKHSSPGACGRQELYQAQPYLDPYLHVIRISSV